MPIQTAEADKRLPVDVLGFPRGRKFHLPGLGTARSRDALFRTSTEPNSLVQNLGVWELPEHPPVSHGVSERKNIPVKFFGWSTLSGVPRSWQLAVWALIDHWPKNSKR